MPQGRTTRAYMAALYDRHRRWRRPPPPPPLAYGEGQEVAVVGGGGQERGVLTWNDRLLRMIERFSVLVAQAGQPTCAPGVAESLTEPQALLGSEGPVSARVGALSAYLRAEEQELEQQQQQPGGEKEKRELALAAEIGLSVAKVHLMQWCGDGRRRARGAADDDDWSALGALDVDSDACTAGALLPAEMDFVLGSVSELAAPGTAADVANVWADRLVFCLKEDEDGAAPGGEPGWAGLRLRLDPGDPFADGYVVVFHRGPLVGLGQPAAARPVAVVRAQERLLQEAGPAALVSETPELNSRLWRAVLLIGRGLERAVRGGVRWTGKLAIAILRYWRWCLGLLLTNRVAYLAFMAGGFVLPLFLPPKTMRILSWIIRKVCLNGVQSLTAVLFWVGHKINPNDSKKAEGFAAHYEPILSYLFSGVSCGPLTMFVLGADWLDWKWPTAEEARSYLWGKIPEAMGWTAAGNAVSSVIDLLPQYKGPATDPLGLESTWAWQLSKALGLNL